MNFKQWIKQAYGVDSDDHTARFTVFNMEVAYEAGKQQNDWINVKDDLPQRYVECLVYPWISDNIVTAELRNYWWVYFEYITGYGYNEVSLPEGRITHWKYLKGPEDK